MADQSNNAAASEKRCLKCSETKPLESFYKSRGRKDGLYPYCSVCTRADVKKFQSGQEWKERKRVYDKARCDTMRDKINTESSARYYANREACLANAKVWVANNPERRRATLQSYKARRRSVERAGIGGAELLAWTDAQTKRCYWCGIDCRKEFQVDHYVPLSKGGKHETANLVIACKPCNQSKSAKDPIAFANTKGRLL